ncbi:MAG: cation:proton antiporter [Gammaproteobacteria bacterium]|nr:cation:proton antiporter [Gammaproteobacteria bacterium]
MHDVISSIEFQMSLLLFVSLAGYLLASRIGQPAVVGTILVGLIIGPSFLGLITYTDFVSSVAHLGAIILLFVVGLEFKLRDIVDIRYGVIGLFGVLVPWCGGYFLAQWFGFETQRALLIGVALTATSIAITADTLREMGKLQSAAAKAIIGAAVIDDILALLALSITNQLAAGALSFGVISVALLKAIAFLVIGAVVGLSVLTRLVIWIDASALARRYPEFVFVVAIMVAFLYALIAELLGLSAIVGAFIAGVSLEGVNLKFSRNFREGAEYLRIVFGAIFFVSLGVLADVNALSSSVITFVLVLTLVAIVTKVLGCGIPARLQGMNLRDSLIVGFGMAPRGEVAMVIALIGLNQGLIEQPSYVALVMMSLLTAMVTPLIFRNWLYKNAPHIT